MSAAFPFHRLIDHFDVPGNESWRSDNPDEEFVMTLRKYQRQPGLVRPTPRRRSIFVQPIGAFGGEWDVAIAVAREGLDAFFNVPVTVLPALSEREIPDQYWRESPILGENWAQANGSYVLNDLLLPRVPRNAVVMKALTSFDLWDGECLNYVFGLGDLEDRVAVSSLWRFGEFSGESLKLALLRTVKTAIHEVAHAFSLVHCVEYACCLNGSNDGDEGDLQPLELCPSCLEKLAWNIGFDPLDHLFRMQKFCTRWGFYEEAKRFEDLIAACGGADIFEGEADLIVSAHGDHNFTWAWVEHRGEHLYGFLDNLVGVKAVTDACFHGDLTDARVEITYGEESGMAGAVEIAQTVGSEDVVVVVDVTGYATDRDIVVEKCSDPWTYELVRRAFAGATFTYEIFSNCGDPICQIDETDVYRQVTERCFLLGIPCEGGDYNSHAVRCRERSIEAATQALGLLLRQLIIQERK